MAWTAPKTDWTPADGVADTDLNAIGNNLVALKTEADAAVPNTRSVLAGSGMIGGGALSANITLSHADTSSQASVDNSTNTVIQDITLDTYGHVTALGSHAITASDVGLGSVTNNAQMPIVGGTFTGAITLGGETDSGSHTIGFTEYDNGSSGSSKTVDFRLSNKQKISISANTTLSFTAPSKPCSLTLKLTYAGAYTVALPTCKTQGGTALTFTSTTGAIDILSIYYDGATYYIMISKGWA